uniref:Post-GPI attachment to proteins factor 3 n=1 Tax=Hydatigena taeniaeformis TaxID=6205 RepID=A0A0R3WLR8_HYDTA
LFGAQEPAAAFFSLLNLATQLMGMRRFLLHVPPQAPLYAFWVLFASKLDYCSAFAYVGSFFIITLARLTRGHLRWARTAMLCITFHLIFSYLVDLITTSGIKYDLNMKVNLTLGLLTLVGWLVGVPKARDGEKQTSYRVMQATVFYIAIVALLEFIDFPAILWLFDAHSLWHAATILIPFPIFSYAIKDCHNLHRIELKVRT